MKLRKVWDAKSFDTIELYINAKDFSTIYSRRSQMWNYNTECVTNRVVVELGAVVVVHAGGLVKHEPSLGHGLLSSSPQHVCYGPLLASLRREE